MIDGSPYCCEGMRFAIEDAGHGIFVVVRGLEHPRLCMYAMSRDGSFCAQTGLPFCPACGRPTRELLGAHPAHYSELARQHSIQFPRFSD